MKKFISAALCLILAFSMLGVNAFAAANADINNDKSIDAEDARSILRAAVGLDKLKPEQIIAADIDMDGEVSASDARLALRIAVNLEKTNGKLYNNEFEILSSGFFYADMDISDENGTQNIKMAVTDKSTYFSMKLSEDLFGNDPDFAGLGNINMSFLFNEKDTYFINDSNKTYAPMNALFALAGGDFSEDDLRESLGDMDMGFGFELSDANNIVPESINGVSCKKYIFSSSDGSSVNVYMNGKKLVCVRFMNSAGKEEARYSFNAVTLTVPTGYTAPSSAYKEVDPFIMLAGLMLGGN